MSRQVTARAMWGRERPYLADEGASIVLKDPTRREKEDTPRAPGPDRH